MAELKREMKYEDEDGWMQEWFESGPERKPDIQVKEETSEVEEDLLSESEEDLVCGEGGVKSNRDVPDLRFNANKGDAAPKKFAQHVGNLCLFRCPTCKRAFKQLSSIKKHFMKFRTCQLVKTADCLHKAVYHSCKICSEEILNDKLVLQEHLEQNHESCTKTIDDYCRTFGITRWRASMHEDHNAIRKKLKRRKGSYSESVGSLCLFKCLTCGQEFPSFKHLKDHENYAGHFGGTVDQKILKLTWHVCRVCRCAIICDSYFFNRHLSRHRLKITEYVNRFGLRTRNLYEQLNEMVSELMKKAKLTDKVGNQCHFKCQVCLRNFTSLGVLHNHQRKEKHGVPVHNRIDIINKHICKLVGHKCRICQVLIVCDYAFLQKHVVNHHKYESLTKYCSKYHLQQEHANKSASFKKEELLRETNNSSGIMANKCKFKCPVCLQIFPTWLTVQNHFRKTSHGKTGQEHIEKCIYKSVFYKCKLCDTRVLCDGRMFTLHLQQFHKGMSREKYEIYLKGPQMQPSLSNNVGDLCEYKCGKCKVTKGSWAKMSKHLQEFGHGEIQFDTRKTLMTRHVVHVCKICSREIICDLTSIQDHLNKNHSLEVKEYVMTFGIELKRDDATLLDSYKLRREEFIKDIPVCQAQEKQTLGQNSIPARMLSKHIGDLCTFKCPLCKTGRLHSWASVWHHMNTNHDMSPKNPFDKKFLDEARYHSCLICQKILLCDHHALRQHLRIHKISMDSYAQTVRRHGGTYFKNFAGQRKSAKAKRQQQDNVANRAFNIKPCSVRVEKLP